MIKYLLWGRFAISASTKTTVFAMFDGKATVGYSTTLGNYVIIESTNKDHKLGFEQNTIWVSYAHLDSYVNNINGKTIKQRDLIGYSGNSGTIAAKIDKWQYHLHVTIYQSQLSVGCLGLFGIASFSMSLLKARLLPCISKIEYGKQELSF